MNDIGDIIGLVVIVGIVVLKAIGNALSQKQTPPDRGTPERSSGGTGEDTFSWEDWGWEPPTPKTAEAAPAQPAASNERAADTQQRPQFERQAQAAMAPPDDVAAPPAEWQAPEGWLTSPDEHDGGAAEGQGYYQHVSTPDPQAAYNRAAWDSASVADQSFRYAFPEAMKKVRRLRRGTREPIVLSVKNRRDLQRGILLREVLMQPRAYDL